MKKIITSILSILMCITLTSGAYADENTANLQPQETFINEYESLKSLANETKSELSKKGYSENDINTIKNYKSKYIERLNSHKKLTDSELIEFGYTKNQIDVLRDFSGSEDEIQTLAATCTITIPIEYVKWSESAKKTTAKFNVNFSWSVEPLVVLTDVIAVNWNDWTLSSSSSSVTYRKRVGSASDIVKSATKVNNNGPQSFGVGYRFKMNEQTSSGAYYAKVGRFTFNVYHNYSKKDLSLYAAYGHNTVASTPSFSIPGWGGISFTLSVKKQAEQWNNRKCS